MNEFTNDSTLSELPSSAKTANEVPLRQEPAHAHRIVRWTLMILIVGGIFLGGWAARSSYLPPSSAAIAGDTGGSVASALSVPASYPKSVDFQLFWDVWNQVKARSIERPIDDRTLFYGATKGIVASLKDPYSVLLDPEEAKKFNEDLSGSFGGIGAEIGIRNNQLVIVAPLSASPAERSGIKSGDAIISIDGVESSTLALDEAVTRIRGKRGTVVKLMIFRQGFKQPKEFSIKRDTIEIKSVEWKWAEPTILPKAIANKKVALVKISSFDEHVQERFLKAVRELLAGGSQAIVVDLRNNPGGLLDAAVDVAGAWIDHNLVVVEQKGRDASAERVEYRSDTTPIIGDLPTALLVNQGSASAAEILAGALQDYGAAVLIGTKTFGKGSVQELNRLSDGSSLKLTIAKWLTPHGRAIDKNGIEPNVVVEPSEKESDGDVQLKRALEELVKKIK